VERVVARAPDCTMHAQGQDTSKGTHGVMGSDAQSKSPAVHPLDHYKDGFTGTRLQREHLQQETLPRMRVTGSELGTDTQMQSHSVADTDFI